jgi:hypothetical protein
LIVSKTGAQDIPYRFHYQPIVLGRPFAAPVPFCPKLMTASDQINFLSRFYSGSGSSQRSVVIMALRRRFAPKSSYRRFEDTA